MSITIPQAELIEVNKLKLDGQNPNRMTERQLARLKTSIEKYGFIVPIIHSSLPNQIVADWFGGSGSTLIACEQTKRRCYMMEIDPRYCQVIIDRWESYTDQKAEKVN